MLQEKFKGFAGCS